MVTWLQRALLVVIVALVGWQVVTRGNDQILAERLSAPYDTRWTPLLNPLERVAPEDSRILTADAWSTLAEQAFLAGDLTASEAYALRGINENITSGRAVSQLMRAYQQSDLERADKLAELADRLWPVHIDVQVALTAHWLLPPADVEKGLEAMHIILSRTSFYNERLFPAMHSLLAEKHGGTILLEYVKQAPNWWPSFFAYLAQHEPNIDTLSQYYQVRTASEKPLLKSERIPYINRLIKEKRWQQARQIWRETLDPIQKKVDGQPYDGGFEGDLYGEGFAWHLTPTPLVTIKPGTTGNVTGQQALHVNFKNQKKPLNFQHVWQRLTLSPDTYALTLRYRLDDFNTAKGLQWRIRCDNQENTILGESSALKGRSDGWKSLKIAIDIPEPATENQVDCTAQILRLEASSHYAHEQVFQGGLWFDDITIQTNSDHDSDKH